VGGGRAWGGSRVGHGLGVRPAEPRPRGELGRARAPRRPRHGGRRRQWRALPAPRIRARRRRLERAAGARARWRGARGAWAAGPALSRRAGGERGGPGARMRRREPETPPPNSAAGPDAWALRCRRVCDAGQAERSATASSRWFALRGPSTPRRPSGALESQRDGAEDRRLHLAPVRRADQMIRRAEASATRTSVRPCCMSCQFRCQGSGSVARTSLVRPPALLFARLFSQIRLIKKPPSLREGISRPSLRNQVSVHSTYISPRPILRLEPSSGFLKVLDLDGAESSAQHCLKF
jgi:hypothetical protein